MTLIFLLKDSVPKEEEPVEDEPPPSKQLRLSDFKEPPPPPTISPSSKDHSIDQGNNAGFFLPKFWRLTEALSLQSIEFFCQSLSFFGKVLEFFPSSLLYVLYKHIFLL